MGHLHATVQNKSIHLKILKVQDQKINVLIGIKIFSLDLNQKIWDTHSDL
jgi:hypothetical protein